MYIVWYMYIVMCIYSMYIYIYILCVYIYIYLKYVYIYSMCIYKVCIIYIYLCVYMYEYIHCILYIYIYYIYIVCMHIYAFRISRMLSYLTSTVYHLCAIALTSGFLASRASLRPLPGRNWTIGLSHRVIFSGYRARVWWPIRWYIWWFYCITSHKWSRKCWEIDYDRHDFD